MILATSLPKTGYSARAVLAAYRLRWQIELAFKRLKSLLHIDRLPTWTERGSRSWLYAHLILALLCDDLSQDFLDSSPSGLARRGLRPLAVGGTENCADGAAWHRHRPPLCRQHRRVTPSGSPAPRQCAEKAQTAHPIPRPGPILARMGQNPLPHPVAPGADHQREGEAR